MIVDAHLHAYRSAEIGREEKGGYPIHEYGDGSPVYSARDGTVDDAVAALAEAGASHAVVLEVFTVPGLPFPPAGRFWPSAPAFREHAAALIAGNEWVCSLRAAHPGLLPFVCVHPAVMTGEETVAHVEALGPAGVKLHTIGQRLDPDDPGLRPLFAWCASRGLPVVAHCGPDRHGRDLATPAAFAPVLRRFPALPLVLAHLGGAAWRDVPALAAEFPGVRFDLSEIVSWTGSERGPSASALAELIRAVGTQRVLFGSDFPWYDPAEVVRRVEALPGLSDRDRGLILGGNAAALLRLG